MHEEREGWDGKDIHNKNYLHALERLSIERKQKNPALNSLYDTLFTNQPEVQAKSLEKRIMELKELYMHVSRRARVFGELLATKGKTRELKNRKGDKESADIINSERRRTSEREFKSVADVFHLSEIGYKKAMSQLHVDPEEFTLQALLQYRKKIAKQLGDCTIQMLYGEAMPSRDSIRDIISHHIQLKRTELKTLQENLKIAEQRRIMGPATDDLAKREEEYIKAAKAEIYIRREITALEEYRESLFRP